MRITLAEAEIKEACRQWLFFRGLKVTSDDLVAEGGPPVHYAAEAETVYPRPSEAKAGRCPYPGLHHRTCTCEGQGGGR